MNPRDGMAPEPGLQGLPPEPLADDVDQEDELHPARELPLHLLRMFETRMDAAGIALRGEAELVKARLTLKIIGASALFFAVWGGIVLLAVALPPQLRVPVLAGVVAAFVIAGVVALVMATRRVSNREIGSLHWFFDSLRQDLEVLARVLARRQAAKRNANGSDADDLAA